MTPEPPTPPTPAEPTVEINDSTSITSYEVSELLGSEFDVKGSVENLEEGDIVKGSFAENSIWRVDDSREVDANVQNGSFVFDGQISVSEAPLETTTSSEVFTVSVIRNGEAVATDTITLQMTYTAGGSTRKSTSKK